MSKDVKEYRKKPVVVQALQYTGDNFNFIRLFVGNDTVLHQLGDSVLSIGTLEGQMSFSPGDWVIRGVKGEFYPCKDNIFRLTYEPVRRVKAGRRKGT